MRTLLIIGILTSYLFATGSSVGNLKSTKSTQDYQAMSSGYWDTRNDTIADDTTVIGTKFPGLMCITIANESVNDMTIIYTTESSPTLKRTKVIQSYSNSGLMPVIHTIYGTAAGSTAGTITLYFWNTKN